MSAGAVVGIILGLVLLLVAVIVFVVVGRRKRFLAKMVCTRCNPPPPPPPPSLPTELYALVGRLPCWSADFELPFCV